MSIAVPDLRGATSVRPESRRSLRVLTLTPFFPSLEDSTQGVFLSDPLMWTEHIGINNEVIAVQPFYRPQSHELRSEISCRWRSYFTIPGNLGLPTSGVLLSGSLLSGVRRLHRSNPFDLIHAHAALPCGQAAAILAKKLAIPFVVTVHGLDVFAARQTGAALANWSQRASASVYRRAKSVICISEEVRARVAAATAANTVVIHNGVDANLFCPAPESKSPLIVLSVGNLIPIKGHAVLLRAFARVVKSVADCRLEIIGDGCERENLVRLAKALGITSHVVFAGRQSRQAVAVAMKQCAVFALPSSYEGLGCVYLEAMACAKPAIGCTGQGIADIIQHGKNGMLVPPENEIELANGLQTLLQNEDYRRRLGDSARNTILAGYTLRHQAEKLISMYREAVG